MPGFLRVLHIGFRNNFHQGCAGAIIINTGIIIIQVVNAFARVLFHVYAVKLYVAYTMLRFNGYIATFTNRRGMLAYLVAFRQVGIEIVFTGKIVIAFNFTVAGNTYSYGKFNRFTVCFWQCARVAKGNWAYVGIRRRAKRNTVAAKQFTIGS